MKKTILEKVADNKFNAVKQLVRFIRENDKNPGGFEDLWDCLLYTSPSPRD